MLGFVFTFETFLLQADLLKI